MTTAAQMIAYFQSMDPDTEVECGKEVTSGYSTYMTMAAVDIDSCVQYDYTSESDRAKYPHMAGRRIVSIQAD